MSPIVRLIARTDDRVAPAWMGGSHPSCRAFASYITGRQTGVPNPAHEIPHPYIAVSLQNNWIETNQPVPLRISAEHPIAVALLRSTRCRCSRPTGISTGAAGRERSRHGRWCGRIQV